MIAEGLSQVVPLLDRGDEQIGPVAEPGSDVPPRHVRTDGARSPDHRPEGFAGDREREDLLGVRVQDAMRIGAGGVDRGMDEALEVRRPGVVVNRIALEIEAHDVVFADLTGAQ